MLVFAVFLTGFTPKTGVFWGITRVSEPCNEQHQVTEAVQCWANLTVVKKG